MRYLLLLAVGALIAGTVFAETDYIALPRVVALEKAQSTDDGRITATSNYFASTTYKATISQYSDAYAAVDSALAVTNFTPAYAGQLLLLQGPTNSIWVGTNTGIGQWVRLSP